ncbi:hypothetical protein DL770_006977 [Monosporascus sp. CRB-9-2]|nr:hypothetical protein DL770_006977 [Monosporascus sp. CRB-9-2]
MMYDDKHAPTSFKVGDTVYLRQASAASKGHERAEGGEAQGNNRNEGNNDEGDPPENSGVDGNSTEDDGDQGNAQDRVQGGGCQEMNP